MDVEPPQTHGTLNMIICCIKIHDTCAWRI